MKTYKTKRARCPICGIRPNRATHAYSTPVLGLPPKKPTTGDVAVCWNCGAVNIYADDAGNLRTPDAGESAALSRDSRLQNMARDIRSRKNETIHRR